MNGGGGELAVLPLNIHLESAAGAQALDAAVRPGMGQGGEQLNFMVLTLQQQLGDARGAAEVAVNLKGRMRVEQVRVSTCGAEQKL